MQTARPLLFIILYFLVSLPSSAQVLPYLDSTQSVSRRVEDLLSRMNLDEKIGQMMQVDLGALGRNPSILTTYLVGSVLSGGDADPAAGNSVLSWANTYDTMQVYALKTPLRIPIIYGIDAVHGHNNVIGATIFPHNIGLGCTRNPALIKSAARITAVEIAATGIDWTFAPCIAVPRDIRWGRTYEGYGETPELAQQLGSSAVAGLQGDSLSMPTSILACAKHFVGDGGTTGGTDQGNTELNETDIRSIHLPGYIAAIDSSVGSVMVSFSSINGKKMHGSKYWITDVLKQQLGFKGIVVSDWNGIEQIASDYTVCVDSSINAGIDMVMMSTHYSEFMTAMRSLVNAGKISPARVDDAVRRILTAKFKLGLFERPFTDRNLLQFFGSPAHRAVARQCVRESMVLLKKKDGILPLRKSSARILVAGSNASDIGNQCGGWTITWQGRSGATTPGTTILQGMRNAAPSAQIDSSKTGDFANTNADYSVVIIGETPYAEGNGDSRDLSITKSDVDLVKKMKSYGAPVIVILVSGRPMILEKILHYSDVIIAAWLPGTEGDGVADVLFGDYQPKGILSRTWPKSMSQIPLNTGDANYSPLYPYGYGITTLNNSAPGSAPVCLSSIISVDGKHFELTFNKRMRETTSLTGLFQAFRNTVPISTSTRWSLKPGDSTTIVVELDSVFYTRDDAGSISYTSGTLASFDNGVLQPFGPIEAYSWVRPAIAQIPARIEAENYSDMLGVQIEPTTDVNGGSQVSGIDDGDWMEYAINVPANGNYYITLRYASESAAGEVRLSINKTIGATLSLPSTGSWTSWKTVSTRPPIYGGEQTLVINAVKGGFRLNWFSITTTPVGVQDAELIPLENRLDQNYPNPFNPSTEIQYSINQFGPVHLSIYNTLGQQVLVLVNERKSPGRYSCRLDGSHLSSGVYFYKLVTPTFSDIKKLVLLK
ncbi:MAG: carbohydrate-binding protein [Ignavibacteriae bacterium]|nr:MAG: carbohydrate-binding protein [Ignavibacteriota bacterium]